MKKLLTSFLLGIYLLTPAQAGILDKLFGKKETPTEIQTKNTLSNIKIRVRFSPRGGAEKLILEEISRAQKQILVAVFSFTNMKIAKALVDAKNRGVKVYVITDEGQAESKHGRKVIEFLASHGVKVKIKRGSGGGLMHHKYAVIDGRVVLTGSYNWTYSAEKRNDENLVAIEGSRNLARAYFENFKALWQNARPFYP
jgi:phosphatidylserine/phosphatidylglycerophosphate/cardiolipin synthase-like enzyme